MGRSGTRAAIYARISEDRAGTEAGVDRQRKDSAALARQRGLKVVQTFVDNDVSAFSGRRRPEFERLMALVESGGIDVVVVWHTSRLFRNRTERIKGLEVMRAAGVSLLPVKGQEIDLSSAAGRMVANLLGEFDAYESEVKAERISRAAEDRITAGKFSGGVRRFGYNETATATVKAEADALRWAYREIAAGSSVRSIVKEFEARGLRGAIGGRITSQQLRSALMRPCNAGLVAYKGEIVADAKSKMPRIVDEALWRQVRAILEDPSRRSTKGRPPKTLLTGIMTCGSCGGPVRAHIRVDSRKPEDKRRRETYRCHEKHCTVAPRLDVDELIVDLVLEALTKHRSALRKAVVKDNPQAVKAAREADRLRAELGSLADLLSAGDLNAADYARATRRLRDRLSEVETEIPATSTSAVAPLLAESDLRRAWAGLDVEARRSILRELCRSVVLHKGQPSNRFDPDRVEVRWAPVFTGGKR